MVASAAVEDDVHEMVAVLVDEAEEVAAEEVAADPRAAMMARLMQLDRQRRQLRTWMDAEEAADQMRPEVRGRDLVGPDARSDDLDADEQS